ncbi:MAG: hypothetical protein A3A33_04840 [Candidatus Yanofskybacteria bacterium RIFCSPLOWO2_01_FULL_49_25]|uniref:GTP cyclohydrolase II n=1 Tax=Candidatus Yanofskybacteria bacterium RIFCSPLOWO2_01_FULL_49_25 TaxID=1802701 RepID=A0A1F8GSU6_9BACT|nr:MAG: hypothetical protein A3A33_04840 [Candidatus Yanofskybacteria bacterium RIFCSPLOWO2_01_FULL_49_25]
MKKIPFEKIGPMRLPVLLADGRVENFKLYTYRFAKDGIYYVVEKGDVRNTLNPLVRMHSACSFGHVMNSQRCDDKFQLDEAFLKISESKAGLIIYIWPHEGRGVGMWDHTRVYMEQDKGEDTVSSYVALGLPVDSRNYHNAAAILKDYGITKMRLLTNNPKKVGALKNAGIKVTRIPLIARLSKYNESQIKVKVEKLGHYYDLATARAKSQVLFYEGRRGLKFVLKNMLDELSPGETYRVFASGKMAPALGSYYRSFQKEKVKKSIRSLILYSENMRSKKTILNVTKGEKKFYSIPPFSSDTFIYHDKVLIVSYAAKPSFAVCIADQGPTQSYQEIFDGLWRNLQVT